MNVSLEWYEVAAAAHVGVLRNVECLRRGYRERLRGKAESWERHVLGALGEAAFSKATNRYWSGSVNTFTNRADVGGTIQVRTRSQHDYDLIVRDEDKDGDIYVHVTGGPLHFVVHGWIRCRDAKQPHYRKDYGRYGDAYFVPAKQLRDPALLMSGDDL